MKSLFNGLLCASLLVFAVGCGKENKSGKKNGYAIWDMYGQGGVAVQNLQQWYQSAETTQQNMGGMRTETRKVEIYNPNGGCSTKTFLGFIDFNVCLSSNAIQSSNNVQTQVAPIPYGQPRSSVPRLAEVFNPGAGMAVANINQLGGSVYEIVVYNSTNGNSIKYKIDTALNAAFNPVEKFDTAALRKEYLINIQ